MARNGSKGFTMIELMIVVAIIGILAAIALPRFADMMEKSREGSTKGNSGTMRSANAIYYGDNPGVWPSTLSTLSPFRYSLYLDGVPFVKVTGKFDPTTSVSPQSMEVSQGTSGQVPDTQGTGWLYDSTLGHLYVNSTLRDSKKVPYSFYGFE